MRCAWAASLDGRKDKRSPARAGDLLVSCDRSRAELPLRRRRGRGLGRLLSGQPAEVLLDQRTEPGRHLIRAGREHAVHAFAFDLAAETELDLPDALAKLLLQPGDLRQVLERVAEPQITQRGDGPVDVRDV